MIEPELEVQRPRPNAAVIVLRGEHDLSTRDALASAVNERIAADELVVVDLSAADFIDSSVLGVLAQANQRAKTAGTRFRLQLGTAAIVKRVLEISQLLNHLDYATTREQALAD
jgi:anti-sigma B factor antagonist